MEIPKKYFINDTVHRCLNDGSNGNISCGFLHKPNANFTQRHLVRSEYGAFILLCGSGTYIDEAGNSTPIKPGCFVQRLPNIPHSTIVDSTGDWLEFFICFDAKTFNTLTGLNLLQDAPVIKSALSPLLLQKCILLIELFKKTPQDQISKLYIAALDFVFFIFSESKYLNSRASEQKLMAKACELLCTSEPYFLSPKQVADALHIGFESFRKKFKQHYQISPGAYQSNYRINYSKTLLLNTQKTISEVAYICQYSDAFSYSNAFKRQCGESPNHFRKTHM